MRIDIEIPDFLIEEGRSIHIMAGQEQLAYRLADGIWHVKTVACNSCGACCTGCEALTDEKLCALYEGMGRPFLCCTAVNHIKRIPECVEEYS